MNNFGSKHVFGLNGQKLSVRDVKAIATTVQPDGVVATAKQVLAIKCHLLVWRSLSTVQTLATSVL